MAMMSVVYWQPMDGLMAQGDRLGNPYTSSQSGAVLHSSHELGELLQCFKHDEGIIVTIISAFCLLHSAAL